MLLIMLAFSCGGDVPEMDAAPLMMLKDRGDHSAPEIASELVLKPTRTYADTMDLGTSYLWQGDYFRAAETYEIAARQADTRQRLAAAVYAKATAAGYAGHIGPALAAANYLVRLEPDNAEAAWLRFALARHNVDALQLAVARDHVVRVDPSASGHEVCDPLTVGIIVGGAVVAVVSASAVAMTYLTPPEDRAEVVVPMFQGIAAVAGGAFKALLPVMSGAGDLGRRIALAE